MRVSLFVLVAAMAIAPSLTAQANKREGTDAFLFELEDLTMSGRLGSFPTGQNGLAMSTTICNTGTEDLFWVAPMKPRHPFIAFMVVRETDGRLTQISDRSYVKHGFFAVNDFQCGNCQHPGTAELLGPQCADTYSVFNNSDRFWLGPADEIDPWLGIWDPQCSHFDRGEPAVDPPQDCDEIRSLTRDQVDAMDPVTHLVEIDDADLNVPDSNYYYYAYYVVRYEPEDVRRDNSAHREFEPAWVGNRWDFSNVSGTRRGSILSRWDGATVTNAKNGEDDDGRVYLAAKVSGPDGNGMYHYEYAIHNRDNRDGISSWSIPLCPGANVSNIGFSDVDDNVGNDWNAIVGASELVFSTSDNPLNWNTMYNFWFDCDVPPSDARHTLTQFVQRDHAGAFDIHGQAPVGPSPAIDLGFATNGSNNLRPDFRICGSLGLGQTASMMLRNALPNTSAILFISDLNNPVDFAGGQLVPVPPIWTGLVPTDGNGELIQTFTGPGGGLTLYGQFAVVDPGLGEGIALSNALEITIDP